MCNEEAALAASAAQEALLACCCCLLGDASPHTPCQLRLLIEPQQIGAILGKQGQIISQIRKESGAHIKVAALAAALPGPLCVLWLLQSLLRSLYCHVDKGTESLCRPENAEGDDEVMTIDGSQNAVLDVVRMAISLLRGWQVPLCPPANCPDVTSSDGLSA